MAEIDRPSGEHDATKVEVQVDDYLLTKVRQAVAIADPYVAGAVNVSITLGYETVA